MGKNKNSLRSASFSYHDEHKSNMGIQKDSNEDKDGQGGHNNTCHIVTEVNDPTLSQGIMGANIYDNPSPSECALETPDSQEWASSAPISPRSSISQQSVAWIDYAAFSRIDISCGESSIHSSSRSSFSLDPQDSPIKLGDMNRLNETLRYSSGIENLPSGNSDMFTQEKAYTSSALKSEETNKLLQFEEATAPAESMRREPISVKPRRTAETCRLLDMLEMAAELDKPNKPPTYESTHQDKAQGIENATTSAGSINIFAPPTSKQMPLKQTKDTIAQKASTGKYNATITPPKLQIFSLDDLKKATDGFSKRKVLANSTFGLTFKGSLDTVQNVIVKEIKFENVRTDAQFLAKVERLGEIHHQNIVGIIGACTEYRLLVYEYVNNWSLDKHLTMSNPVTMNWHIRLKVAIGIAKGLSFLHNGCGFTPIIHGDLRSKNVLLNSTYEPKIADAGLKWRLPDDASTETCFIGATGYLAPEYLESGSHTLQTDIYAYGVILLELMTGSSASSRPDQQGCLTEWARPLLKRGRVPELMDKRIQTSIVERQLQMMASIAFMCIDKDPSKRPAMTRVLRALESCANASSDGKGETASTSSKYRHPINHTHKSSGMHETRQAQPSASNDPKRRPPYFLPTDCLRQTGFYALATPQDVYYHQQQQRPYLASTSNAQQQRWRSSHPNRPPPQARIANFHQMPQIWQLPRPYFPNADARRK